MATFPVVYPDHLFVLAHGLQGDTGHMEYLTQVISNACPGVIIMNAASNCGESWNSYWSTSDGVQAGAERIHKELKQFVNQNIIIHQNKATNSYPPTFKISLIGSSLGGLYIRYLAMLLYKEACDMNISDKFALKIEDDVHSSTSISTTSTVMTTTTATNTCSTTSTTTTTKTIIFTPVNFITLASPHISVCGMMSSLTEISTKLLFFRGTGAEMVLADKNYTVFGSSGTSQHSKGISSLDDGQPLIYKMATNSLFLESLGLFSVRVTYASAAKNEWKVPYPSSALSHYYYHQTTQHQPQEQEQEQEQDHPKKSLIVEEHVIGPDFTSTVKPHKNDSTPFYEGTTTEKKTMITEMIQNLTKFKWTCVAINATHAQVAVINKNRKEVADHIVACLKM